MVLRADCRTRIWQPCVRHVYYDSFGSSSRQIAAVPTTDSLYRILPRYDWFVGIHTAGEAVDSQEPHTETGVGDTPGCVVESSSVQCIRCFPQGYSFDRPGKAPSVFERRIPGSDLLVAGDSCLLPVHSRGRNRKPKLQL